MNRQRAFWLMFLVTASWGASYMWMKIALISVAPLFLVGLRFTVAFLATLLIFARILKRPSRGELLASFILGTLLFCAFTFVMISLRHTAASTAGFLLSTTTVFVAFFEAVLKKRFPRLSTIITTILVVLGLYLLVANGADLQLDLNALLCVICAAIYAVYIMASDILAKKHLVTFSVSIWQLGVAGVEGLLFGGMMNGITLPKSASQWGAVLALGLICSAFGFVAQTQVQNYLAPDTVSLIYSLEPIFSAIFAFFTLGEILSPQQYLGAAIMFLSVVASEIVKARSPQSEN
ncbi:DMT family transporter [Secundilactobacillus mixtipabuli]|uniref:Transporter n=1 Tax=Secundilactobacillus mixtipabuli TaxID=1435342 RepID=A0A1Z5I8R9_9LACO|nr:DMT family transporter [Secundilactobacillus mixtipabuli]GAW98154.1 transporter [Secundilactobacillus mixtipabuli]